jgi:hypothetical protein
MNTLKSRMNQIALSLTPKQAVLITLEEAHQQNESIHDYARWLSKPQNLAQIHQRWDQVMKGIRQNLKGQPESIIQKVCRQAKEDICFLLDLHQRVNTDILEDEKARDIMVWYSITHINALVEKHVGCECLPMDTRILQQMLQIWRTLVCQFLISYYALLEAILLIDTQYFEGHSLLFSSTLKELKDCLHNIENQTDFFTQIYIAAGG